MRTVLTENIARAAAQDAGNRNMRKAERSVWSKENIMTKILPDATVECPACDGTGNSCGSDQCWSCGGDGLCKGGDCELCGGSRTVSLAIYREWKKDHLAP